MNGRILIVLSLTISLALVLMHLDSKKIDGATKLIVSAKHTQIAPIGLDDSLWQKARAIQIPFEGKERFAGRKATVTTRVLYTDDSIYFLFNWKDMTRSVTKGAWRFDGEKWSHIKGNEDRISLLFEITKINKFATRGCAIVCHVPKGASAGAGKFGTRSVAEKGDLWHWKAARSDPAGFADDTWLTKVGEKKGGRKSDAGKGGDKRNRTKDRSKPMYMAAPGKGPGKHGVLLAEDAVEITDYSRFKAGDTITYRMPKKYEGSRGDIKAVSRYGGGGWTLMLSRNLDTGHDDDVTFNPTREYNFAMALFDDSGDEDSYDSEAMTLKFSR